MNINQMGLMIGSFIVIVVGVILADTLADSLYQATTLSTVTQNESVTISAGVGTLANDDVTQIYYFGGSNLSTKTTGISLNTQVNITDKATSTIRVDSVNFSNGKWNCTYEYEGTDYVADNQSRTILNMIPIFFVLAIVLVGYIVVTKSYSDMF